MSSRSSASAGEIIPTAATRGAIAYFSFLTDPQHYPFTCASCHGNIVGGASLRRINANKAHYGSRQLSLEDYIHQEMPQISTQLCVDDCALDTAAYIQSFGNQANPYPFIIDTYDDQPLQQAPAQAHVWLEANPAPTDTRLYARVMPSADAGAHLEIHSDTGRAAMVTYRLPGDLYQVHLRFYFKLQRPLANGESIFGFKSTPLHNFVDIQVGRFNDALGVRLTGAEALALNPNAAHFEADRWYCAEIGVAGTADARRSDHQSDQLTLWIDEKQVLQIDASDAWQGTPPSLTWLQGRLNYAYLGLGSPSGQANRLDIDNLMLAVHPIGCASDP